MIYRVIRYRVSLEAETVEQLLDHEFEHDEPPLSVYRTSLDDLPQLHAEHCAHARMDPPNRALGVDVSSFASAVIHDPPDPTFFAYIRDAHHVVAQPGDMRSFVEQVLQQLRACASIQTDKALVREYVCDLVERQDAEWVAFLATANDKWRKYARAQ